MGKKCFEFPIRLEQKSAIYLWVVPAMVMGHWITRVLLSGGAREVTRDVAQSFQTLSGAAAVLGGAFRSSART